MNFDSFNLHPRVRSAIPAAFTIPTPIQTQSIPLVMQGKDLLGLAQTGTGKTAAFVLPILNKLMQGKPGKVRALIIAPTRELAEQIRVTIDELGKQSALKSLAIYGGVNMSGQIRRLRQGVDIIVACPGRLLDHIERRSVDLRDLEVLVLDEADQMFDMGFLPTIRKILKALPVAKQTLLFSATMPSEVHGLATEILKEPALIQVGRTAPAKTVTHGIYTVDQSRKTDLLLKILESTGSGSVLVFTRTKHGAKKLGVKLESAGYRAASLQGNLSQHKRQAALDGFRSGKFQILVATDIAARGIDIESVTHVINFDIPNTVDAYTHRIGRTGRAERNGDALTFVTAEDEGMVRSIERVLGSKIDRRSMAGFGRSKGPVQHKDSTEQDFRRKRFRGRGFSERGTGHRFHRRGRFNGRSQASPQYSH